MKRKCQKDFFKWFSVYCHIKKTQIRVILPVGFVRSMQHYLIFGMYILVA
jgi:hypothetical protein